MSSTYDTRVRFRNLAIQANFTSNATDKNACIREMKLLMQNETDTAEKLRMENTIKTLTQGQNNNAVYDHVI